jgi:hypothetical protein
MTRSGGKVKNALPNSRPGQLSACVHFAFGSFGRLQRVSFEFAAGREGRPLGSGTRRPRRPVPDGRGRRDPFL